MRPRSSSSGAALLFGAAAFVLYAATLSRHPSADSLLRALTIEGGGDLGDLIGWRHPLLDALTWGFVALCQRLGWTGRALPLLQALNALAGGICVAVMYHLAAQLTGSLRIAAAVAAGFAVSGGAWLLNTEAELVTPVLAAALFVLDRVIALRDEDWARRGVPLATGLAIGAITILYPTNLALLPVALLAASPDGAGWLRAWLPRAVGLAVGALLPIVAGVAMLAGAALMPLEWATLGRFAESQGYGRLNWFNLPHGAYAVVRSLLLYPGLGMNDSTRDFLAAASAPERVRFAAYYTVATGLAAVAPLGVVARWRALRSAYARPVMLLTTWVVPNAAFALIWVPGDFSFWMPVLCVWWLLIALLLATANARRRAYEVTVVALTAAALLLINGIAFILPRHDLRRNRQYAIAAGVAARTAPADVVVTHYDGLLALYLRYFAQRAVVIAERDNAFRALSTALAQASASGGRVFVVDIAKPAGPLPLTAVTLEDVAESPFWEAQYGGQNADRTADLPLRGVW